MDRKVDLETLRYPIGRFRWDGENGSRSGWLQVVGDTPHQVRRVVSGLTDEQLDTLTAQAAGR